MRTFLNDYDYIAVQLSQETLGSQSDPISSADAITNLVFTVRWSTGYGDADIDIICTNYNITESGSRGSKDGFYYQSFSCSSPLNSPDDYTLGEYEDIALLSASFSGSTSGTFEIAPSGWVTSIVLNVEWNSPNPPSIQYTPGLVIGACDDTPIPTIVYDLVWIGVDATYPTYWDVAANWESTCGGLGSIPNTGNNCIIPVVGSGNYPTNVGQVSGFGVHQPICDYLRINSGASFTIDNQDEASTQALYTISNDMTIYGQLNISPKAELTVSGSSYLDVAECLIVQSTSSGTGSFIDNGTITYGGSGTAKVQTYLTNSGSGDWYIHLVGSTVDEENYIGSGTGAFLEAFNVVNGSTWAYEWDETVVNTSGGEPWVNLSSLTEEILTGKGIGLATNDNLPHTLEMTGALITGDKSSPALTFIENNNELISNPYPSALDFDLFYANSGNNGVIQQKNWVWDAAGGTYLARTTSGGVQYIQVGQAFFVQTLGAGTVSFKNTNRTHSNEAFRDIIPNVLTVNVIGGLENYRDEMIVMFNEEATSGYDIEIEAMKWNSQYDDATQIRSIAEDNTELSINVLPTASLTSGMTSVPMYFNCGYNTEYTLSFFDMETFETGTEIWLEDKQVGGDWISVNDNPDYIFTATPDDLVDRFVLHFFGTTSVDEFDIENTVDIFSYRQYAFVRNNTNEVIKKVYIYSLSGELMQDKEPADIKLNKFWVSDKIGYFVVRVITDSNVYTNKVFISK